MRYKLPLALVLTATLLCPAAADASLTEFATFVGNYGVSTDGFGSTGQTGTISAQVPVGATVIAAYLYTATFGSTNPAVGGTLNASAVTYGPSVPNPDVCCSLASNRADVTAIVAPVINGGPGGVYNFTVTEADSSQDGEALVVVYSLPSLPVSTVGILDGFSSAGGDNTAINFADPLNPTAAGFFADMRLGIGFSCCSGAGISNQRSNVTVNGTLMTAVAGDNDDGLQDGNGSLITVGGFDDIPAPSTTVSLATYAADSERYDLSSFINTGDNSIAIVTDNPSNDDNIFLAVFHVLGEAGINEPPPTQEVPEPGTLSLLALGGAAAVRKVRGRRKA